MPAKFPFGGCMCMPKCTAGKCPAAPGGATAIPTCEFSSTGKPPPDYCGLRCKNGETCPTGTSCEMPTGICAYPYPMGEPEEDDGLVTAFLAIEPVNEPDLCEDVLSRFCGDVQQNETACDHCVRENYKKEKTENCTKRELSTYCSGDKPPSPIRDKCEAFLKKECSSSQAVRSECEACLEKLEKKDGCTLKEEFQFCDGAEPPSPSPPKPEPIHSSCLPFLNKDCGDVRENITECDDCIRKIEPRGRLYNCTHREEATYCDGAHPGPGPHPPVSDPCQQHLKKECGRETTKQKCEDCTQKVGVAAGCNRREEFTFCANKTAIEV